MKAIKSFYLSSRFFFYVLALSLLYVLSYFLGGLFDINNIFFVAIIFLLLSDAFILYLNKKGINAYRETPNRLSNGDENEIRIHLKSNYG